MVEIGGGVLLIVNMGDMVYILVWKYGIVGLFFFGLCLCFVDWICGWGWLSKGVSEREIVNVFGVFVMSLIKFRVCMVLSVLVSVYVFCCCVCVMEYL